MKDLFHDEIVITKQDMKNALAFWTALNIPVPHALKAAADKFESDPTVENQNWFKYQSLKAIAESNHPEFNDEIFSKVKLECAEKAFQMSQMYGE